MKGSTRRSAAGWLYLLVAALMSMGVVIAAASASASSFVKPEETTLAESCRKDDPGCVQLPEVSFEACCSDGDSLDSIRAKVLNPNRQGVSLKIHVWIVRGEMVIAEQHLTLDGGHTSEATFRDLRDCTYQPYAAVWEPGKGGGTWKQLGPFKKVKVNCKTPSPTPTPTPSMTYTSTPTPTLTSSPRPTVPPTTQPPTNRPTTPPATTQPPTSPTGTPSVTPTQPPSPSPSRTPVVPLLPTTGDTAGWSMLGLVGVLMVALGSVVLLALRHRRNRFVVG